MAVSGLAALVMPEREALPALFEEEQCTVHRKAVPGEDTALLCPAGWMVQQGQTSAVSKYWMIGGILILDSENPGMVQVGRDLNGRHTALNNGDNVVFPPAPLGRPDLLRLGDLPRAAVLLSLQCAGFLLPDLQR